MPTVNIPPLLATSWTSAGSAQPQSADERSPLSIRERVEATAEGGWSGIGFVHADLMEYLKRHTIADLRRLLDDNGLVYREIEFLVDWWAQDERRPASDKMRKELFEVALGIGAANVKIAPCTGTDVVDAGQFAEEFDALASEAGEFGTRIAIEPLPFSTNLSTVEDAIELVTEVSNPRAGLCIDVWHVLRGGTSFATLAEKLPREYLFVVELDDADNTPQGTLWEDTVHNRRLLGEGDFDLIEFIHTIKSVGFDGPWGVEILSHEHRARPLNEALQAAKASAVRTFAKAG